MKLKICLICGKYFEAYSTHAHTCDSCNQIDDEANDPAREERIRAAVEARMNQPDAKEDEP